ncbi:hypothetical protein BG004_006835 [Podila humilis]|nr:hypothetical protein BG004_006835 [Podila humilis]
MCDRIIHMPELVEQLSHYLSHSVLLQCVQVSRSWHAAFIPQLWHTLHDGQQPWLRVLTEIESDRCAHGRDLVWLKQTIANNGQHIRHLSICEIATLNACVEATSLTGVTHFTADVDKMISDYGQHLLARTPGEQKQRWGHMTDEEQEAVAKVEPNPASYLPVMSESPTDLPLRDQHTSFVASTNLSDNPTIRSRKVLMPQARAAAAREINKGPNGDSVTIIVQGDSIGRKSLHEDSKENEAQTIVVEASSATMAGAVLEQKTSIFSPSILSSGSNFTKSIFLTKTSLSAAPVTFTFGATSTPAVNPTTPFTFGTINTGNIIAPSFSFNNSTELSYSAWQQFVVDIPSSAFDNYKTAKPGQLRRTRSIWQILRRNKNLQDIQFYGTSHLLRISSKALFRSILSELIQLRNVNYLHTNFNFLAEFPDVAPRLEMIRVGSENDELDAITKPHPNIKIFSAVVPCTTQNLAIAFELYPNMEEIRAQFTPVTDEKPIHFKSKHLKKWSSTNADVLVAKHIKLETNGLTDIRLCDTQGVGQLLRILKKFPFVETFQTSSLLLPEVNASSPEKELTGMLGAMMVDQKRVRFVLKTLSIGIITGQDEKSDPLAQLWPCLPSLKSLSFLPFTSTIFRGVLKHCNKELQSLHANMTDACSSEIKQMLLTCTKLESFTGDGHWMTAEDAASAESWSCKKMEKLHLAIYDSPQPPMQSERMTNVDDKKEQDHRQKSIQDIYQQLEGLSKLRHLRLGVPSMTSAWVPAITVPNVQYPWLERPMSIRTYTPDTLEMTVESGLSKGWKQLVWLDIKNMAHSMETEDVEWMLKQCPKLMRIQGLKGGFEGANKYEARKFRLEKYLKEHHPYVELL